MLPPVIVNSNNSSNEEWWQSQQQCIASTNKHKQLKPVVKKVMQRAWLAYAYMGLLLMTRPACVMKHQQY